METNTQHPITHLSLMRKYNGDIKKAHTLELQAAARAIPEGKNALAVLFEAAREYEREVKEESKKTGVHPAVCFNKDGHCEDDHCRCWK